VPPAAEVAHHEQHLDGRRVEVGTPGVRLEDGIVAEPLSLLVGVHVAAHPGQQAGVVDHGPVRVTESGVAGEPQRDQALPEHVLHRLAHPQVCRQRKRREQLGQPDSGPGNGFRHAMTIRLVAVFPLGAAGC
jgi:hypothetical protein